MRQRTDIWSPSHTASSHTYSQLRPDAGSGAPSLLGRGHTPPLPGRRPPPLPGHVTLPFPSRDSPPLLGREDNSLPGRGTSPTPSRGTPLRPHHRFPPLPGRHVPFLSDHGTTPPLPSRHRGHPLSGSRFPSLTSGRRPGWGSYWISGDGWVSGTYVATRKSVTGRTVSSNRTKRYFHGG